MKRPAADVLVISRWPSIDINALEETTRDRHQQRATAIERYATGVPFVEVEETTKLDRRVLYRMIERALQAHSDGRLWGFRALVPGYRTRRPINGSNRAPAQGWGSQAHSVNCWRNIRNSNNLSAN